MLHTAGNICKEAPERWEEMHEQLELRARKLASETAQKAQQKRNEHEISVRRDVLQLQREQGRLDMEKVRNEMEHERL